MANTLYNSSLICREALAAFEVNCPYTVTSNRGYENEFLRGPYKYGDSFNIRKRNHYIVEDNAGVLNPQNIEQALDPLTINHWYTTGVEIGSKELALNLEDFRQEVILPAVQEVISKVETDIAALAETSLYSFVPRSTTSYINSFGAVDEAGAKLLEMAVPINSDAYIAMSVRDGSALKQGLIPNFTPVINDDIVRNSALGHTSYFDAFQSQNIKSHVAGNGPLLHPSDTLTVNGAVVSGNTIVFAGATASVTNYFLPGDRFSIAGVQSLTPVGRIPTGQDMQFVVTASANSTGGGAVTVTVAPVIISDTTNPRRNVSNVIPNGAAVTVVGSHRVNVAYIRRALDVVFPPMEQLNVRECSITSDARTGISMRFSSQGDITSGVNTYRLEMLAGYAWHPEYAVVVPSKVN
jgi:hypothetical protein